MFHKQFNDREPRLACPQCASLLEYDGERRTRIVHGDFIYQRLWLCPRGHEFWRVDEDQVVKYSPAYYAEKYS